MARLSLPVTTTPADPLFAVAAPFVPPRGTAIDAVRVDDDHIVVIYDPEQFDKPQALLALGLALGRTIIDLDEVTR